MDLTKSKKQRRRPVKRKTKISSASQALPSRKSTRIENRKKAQQEALTQSNKQVNVQYYYLTFRITNKSDYILRTHIYIFVYRIMTQMQRKPNPKKRYI